MEFVIEPPSAEDSDISLSPSARGVPVEVDRETRATSHEIREWYRQHWPQPPEKPAVALELGCADILNKSTLEESGFEYLGVDYDSTHAQLLVDAHSLPFHDGSFPFIVAYAFLEHLQHPMVAMRETWRVLRPGGTLLGTVSFLEPFHMNSFYHHTHLGLINTLRVAGFRNISVVPSGEWTGWAALVQMGLFPDLPIWCQKSIMRPIDTLHRLWWKLLTRRKHRYDERDLILATTGAFNFYATK